MLQEKHSCRNWQGLKNQPSRQRCWDMWVSRRQSRPAGPYSAVTRACGFSGVLTALMGVTGAGKTTMMDVLAGRKTGACCSAAAAD